MIMIAYEDADIVIAVKPFNMPVQSDPSGQMDLLNAVQQLIRERDHENKTILYLVHRLDRATGGLVLFAKHQRAAHHLSIQFQNRTIKRVYHAIVSGIPRQQEERLIDFYGKIDEKIVCTKFEKIINKQKKRYYPIVR
ncbi:pseudouridine synthase [Atopobacter phocae]|uniref:pseudouridine synthase n=1 Tax=Atopobacter phocae TaxID=136492 RepID=UPI0004B70973|nr:pseudouridine synthase [Atopobacter phocae]